MNRRSVLGVVAAIGTGGMGYMIGRNREDIPKIAGSIGDELSNSTKPSNGPYLKEFDGGYFSSLRWDDDGNLHVQFENGHGMDGFGVRHRSDPESSDDVFACSAPEGAGSRSISFIDYMNEHDWSFPSRRFRLFAYEGFFNSCENLHYVYRVTETLGSVDFRVPDSLSEGETFQK